MRHAAAICTAVVLGLAGCGGDDEPEPPAGPVETAPQETEPRATVTVPEPDVDPGAGTGSCSVANLQMPGLRALFAEAVTCAEAEAVVLAWLDECAGEDPGPCEPMAGYSCTQERFAGTRSDVLCARGEGTVSFSFE